MSRIPVNSHLTDKVLLATKTYTNVKPTKDASPEAWLYFAKIHRNNYYDVWHVKYRLYINIIGFDTGVSFHEVDLWGTTDAVKTTRTYNTISDTTYRPMVNHLCRPATTTGVSNDCGDLLGIRFQSAKQVTTNKTIKVEIIEADNCTVELLPAFTLFSTLNTVSGYYTSASLEFDGETAGVTITGDRNTTAITNASEGSVTTIQQD